MIAQVTCPSYLNNCASLTVKVETGGVIEISKNCGLLYFSRSQQMRLRKCLNPLSLSVTTNNHVTSWMFHYYDTCQVIKLNNELTLCIGF